MLSLDAAVILAGQLLSILRGHGQPGKINWPCKSAIKYRGDHDHWGRNLVLFMQKHFEAEYNTNPMALAEDWDKVRHARILASHPPMLSNYDERRATQLISILERSPNPTQIARSSLQILKAREHFLSADPCPDIRSAGGA